MRRDRYVTGYRESAARAGRALVRAAGRRGIPVVATNHFMPENLYGHAAIARDRQVQGTLT